MKTNSIIFLFLLTACATDRNYNISDLEDKNRTPAHLENREEEVLNAPDDNDLNQTENFLEEREEEEERIRVYDDPLFE